MATGVGSEKKYKVSNEKREGVKRKTSTNSSRVFQIASKGGKMEGRGVGGNFSWRSFDHKMLVSC